MMVDTLNTLLGELKTLADVDAAIEKTKKRLALLKRLRRLVEEAGTEADADE